MLYRIVELRRVSFVKGWVTAQELEDVLNKHASAGWVLDQVVEGETAAFLGLGAKKVFLVVLRVDPPVPDGMRCQLGDEQVTVSKQLFTHLVSNQRMTATTPTAVPPDPRWRPLWEAVPELAALLG